LGILSVAGGAEMAHKIGPIPLPGVLLCMILGAVFGWAYFGGEGAVIGVIIGYFGGKLLTNLVVWLSGGGD